MHHIKIAFDETKAFSSFFLDYIQQKPTLKPFYHRFPSVENFEDQIAEKAKSFPQSFRQTLVSTLQRQYSKLTLTESVKNNISALAHDKTFTVTTGHQLNVFTGPLYFIYKIVTVINTCRKLKKLYPEYTFVPVYWMASEDHDYDEIKSFRLYGQRYTWQTSQKGAVGRFKTKDFETLLNELPGNIAPFDQAYRKYETLADAVRYYVNELFGNEGLVVVDADDRQLKSQFHHVMREDIVRQATLPVVEQTNRSLEALQYKTQIFCRPINFFYLDENIRSRIEKEDGYYKVLDTDIRFDEKQILDRIDNEPEKFSPNVILRPLYQETILPNLAYIGGPAEVIYWLQLKEAFAHYNTPFPILIPRNFALVIESHLYKKFQKTGLEVALLFEEKNYLYNHWITLHSKHNLSTHAERLVVEQTFTTLRLRAEAVDKTLGPFVGAECRRALNSLEKIEQKMLRAEKRLQADRLRQIETVKDALFPNGSLQERTDNFLNFQQQDPSFIDKLLQYFDPFDFRFNILIYPAQ